LLHFPEIINCEVFTPKMFKVFKITQTAGYKQDDKLRNLFISDLIFFISFQAEKSLRNMEND